MGLVDFIGDFASVDAGLGMIPGPSSELIAEKVAAAFRRGVEAMEVAS